MGVVKNLMVRVGADLSRFQTGFEKASVTVGSFGKKSADAIKSLSDEMRALKITAIEEGKTNSKIVSITDQIRQLREEQTALQAMGFSWGFAKFEENEAALRSLNSELTEYKNNLASPEVPIQALADSLRTSVIEAESLGAKLAAAKSGLKQLELRGLNIGDADWDDMYQTVNLLTRAVKEYKQALDFTDMPIATMAQMLRESVTDAEGLGNKLHFAKAALKEMEDHGLNAGDADWDDMYQTVSRLTQEVKDYKRSLEKAAGATKDLGNSAKSAGSKVKTASSWIGGLWKNAKASALSVSDLTRSLRRVGVVAVGVKLAGAVLGKFRSLVTGYISQNETLQAKVDELKAGFGQALAPAINVATNALSKMMPYILGVSNAIGTLVTNLFGSGWTTIAEGASAAASATNSATAAQKEYNRTLAGFDQINKLGSGDETSTSNSAGTVTAKEITLPTWLTDLPTQLKEAFSSGDYKGIGATLAEALNEGISDDDENGTTLGSGIAKVIQGGIDCATGFVEELDWTELGETIGTNIADLFSGIDWASIPHLVGVTIGGLGEALWKMITTGVDESGSDGSENTAETIIQRIGSALSKFTSGKWLGEIIEEILAGALGYANSEEMELSFVANLTSWKDSLKEKWLDFSSNLTTWKDSLKEKAVNFKSNLTTWKDSLKEKAVNFKSNLTTWKDSLKEKTVNFKSNLTTWKDSLTNKALSYQAKLTTWKDSLSNKFLEFKANIKAGWTGTLAKALGIESITSKLNLSLPKIAINWETVTVLGKDFKYPTGFDIKWNAEGAILNGAQLFGRVGNTWLGGGEAGREAVLPLDRNTGWMDKIADRVAMRVSAGGIGEQNLVIYLTLDGKVVTKTVIRNINAQAKATGKNPLAAYI